MAFNLLRPNLTVFCEITRNTTHGVQRVVFKPTGHFHRNLRQSLGDAGLRAAIVNPLRSRRFAKAVGVLAKNDRVDAAMQARFGHLDGFKAPRPRRATSCCSMTC